MSLPEACPFCGWSPATAPEDDRAWLNERRESCNATRCVLRLLQETRRSRRWREQRMREETALQVAARMEQRRREDSRRRKYAKTKGRPV